jgi:two-component system NtrC family sensor kinase
VIAPSPVPTDSLVPAGGRVFAEFDIEPADLTYLQTFQETLTPEIQEWIVAQWQAEVAALLWFEDLHLPPDAVAALFATLASFLRRLLAGDRIPELYDELEQVTLVALRHGVRSTDIFQASTKLESVLTGVILQLFSGSDQQTVALVTMAKFLKSLLYVVMETYRREAADEIERRNRELQDRTEQLAHSVAELQALEEVLRAVNSSLDLDTVLATIISRAVQLSQADEGTIYEFNAAEEVFVPKAAFGMNAKRVEALRQRRIKVGETHLGRSALLRAPVYVADVQQDPSVRISPGIHAVLAVPLLRDDKVVGGLVIRRRTEAGFAPTIPTLLQTFAGQAVLAIENAQLFQELAARGEEARRARIAAEAALADLRRAQDRLVQAEKMASLGQLTAGIAHEIKNPLNFVNNFADLSVELLDELKETAAPVLRALDEDKRAEVDETIEMLTGNLEKIAEHGRRADGIVKSMLEHSRGGTGERCSVDLNGLVEEALNLAYHGARAQDQTFNITLDRDLGADIAPIELVPQDVTRVFLNLFGNGFYAANKRARANGDDAFRPMLTVATRDLGDAVEVRVRDNGTGIPSEIKDKLFEPFFTTKPTGEGTGLGLSISYDIVTQQHGGTIEVDSALGEFTEFIVRLPRGRQTASRSATA